MLALIACLPGTAEAREAQNRLPPIDIPALPLSRALEVLGAKAAISIGTEGPLPTVGARAVHHARTAGEALARLLAGTGYVARQVSPTAWRITREAIAHPLAPAPAPAPDTPVSEASIVVTAAKQHLALFYLPQAASVLWLDHATRRDPNRDTGFVAGEVDGLTLTSVGPGRNRLFLRGVADSPYSDLNQSPVTVVLDHSRLTFSAPDPDLRLVDVERIEVLQGPQGTLYGIGAMGGIYHIVTAKPNVDHYAASLLAGINLVAHGQMGESGSAMLNMPVLPGVVGLRLVAYGSREGGWVDTGNRANANTSKVGGGRAALGRDAGGWRIDLNGVHQRINAADSQYTYPPDAFGRPAQLAEPTDNDLDHAAVHVAGKLAGVSLELDGGYTWQEVNNSFDATLGADSLGLASPSLFTEVKTYRVGEVELRLNGRLGRLRWLVGATHTEAREQDIRSLASSAPIRPLTIDSSDRITSETGVFVNLAMPLVPRVILDVGTRAYRAHESSKFLQFDADSPSDLSIWYVTPSASLTWNMTKNRMVYVHFGSANRPGGLDFGETEDIGAIQGDSLRTVETGWREKLPGGGSINTNAFMIWWNNVQSDHILDNGLVAANNAGNARIYGGEASLNLPVGRDWRLATGITFQKTRLLYDPALPASQRSMPSVPSITLRGSLGHDLTLGSISGHVRLGLRYAGPARLSFDPSLNRSTGQVLESCLDAGMEWHRTRFDLRLTNLLNRKDNRFAIGNPFRIATPQYTPQQPISGSLSISRDF